jgi:PKHD-type hydroxylase
MWTLRTPEEQKTQRFQFFAPLAQVFTPQECAQIIQLGTEKFPMIDAEVRGSDIKNQTVDSKIRAGQVSWFNPKDASTHWIYQRITAAVNQVNGNEWQFDLDFIEPLQFTCYTVNGDKYESHIDNLIEGSTYRKLSFSVQLSEPGDYEGAELQFIVGPDDIVAPKFQGCFVAFPSIITHRVSPITQGKRYSLVGWVCGPKFR